MNSAPAPTTLAVKLKTTVALSPRKIGIVLGIIAACMSVAAIIGDLAMDRIHSDSVWPVARQFNFVEEGNFANYYQSAQLLLNSALLLLIWAVQKPTAPDRWRWLVLTAAFLFLSADEVAQIHEATVAVLIAGLRQNEEGKTGWFWVYLPVLAIFAAAYLPFLKRLPRRTAILFVVSGSIYVGGVVVMERISNWVAETYGDHAIGYVVIDNFSEFMESAGMALFAYTLLSYLAKEAPEIALRVGHGTSGGTSGT
ncbi:MAG: hypothetical protein K8R23_11340 [Chthoniobacter sp.]|nr:hypothetical protein [Chthoniobacter sp.]